MKKCLILILCLMLCSTSALAGGLPNLSGGGLPVLDPTPAGNAGVLPDPADVLGYEGGALETLRMVAWPADGKYRFDESLLPSLTEETA